MTTLTVLSARGMSLSLARGASSQFCAEVTNDPYSVNGVSSRGLEIPRGSDDPYTVGVCGGSWC